MVRNWKNKQITVLGFSKSGFAAAKYLIKKEAVVTISEKREQKPEDEQQIEELQALGIKVEMGGHIEETIVNSDIVITSPGIPPHVPVFKLINENNIEIISEIDLAFIEARAPFICITGTNGKTTTTKLVSEILTNAGHKAPACGNIGLPPTNLLEEKPDYFVTEISSFQIEYSQYLKPYIGCFLNDTADHIDWHGSEEAYLDAKIKLFTGKTSCEYAVLNNKDAKIIPIIKQLPKEKVITFGNETENTCMFIENGEIVFKKDRKKEPIIKLNEIKVFGIHNYENIMVAIAISKLAGVKNDIIRKSIMDFNPPEHRIEFVEEIDGIRYFNDSKATNCDASICALRAFEKPVVLIAGGKDKGTDLTEFVNIVKEKANAVVLIGEATQRFFDSMKLQGYDKIYLAESLENAIDIATDLKQGDVLLSPACASFDMFKNYEERGKAFKDYVSKKKSG